MTLTLTHNNGHYVSHIVHPIHVNIKMQAVTAVGYASLRPEDRLLPVCIYGNEGCGWQCTL